MRKLGWRSQAAAQFSRDNTSPESSERSDVGPSSQAKRKVVFGYVIQNVRFCG